MHFTPGHMRRARALAPARVTFHYLGRALPPPPPAGHAGAQQKVGSKRPPSIASLMPASQVVTVWAGGGPRGGTQNTLWRVGGTWPPSVPISCELPHMKGRNWKSSRPHTPWLPAGSILYVFWSFRITSRYLHRRVGKRGEEVKEEISLNPSAAGSTGGRKPPLTADGSASGNLRARAVISRHSPSDRALFFSSTLSLLLAQERGKTPPGKGGSCHQLLTTKTRGRSLSFLTPALPIAKLVGVEAARLRLFSASLRCCHRAAASEAPWSSRAGVAGAGPGTGTVSAVW